jgi:hypothetical protein
MDILIKDFYRNLFGIPKVYRKDKWRQEPSGHFGFIYCSLAKKMRVEKDKTWFTVSSFPTDVLGRMKFHPEF